MTAILTATKPAATDDRGTGRIYYRLHLTCQEEFSDRCPNTGLYDSWLEWVHDEATIEVPDLGPYGAYNAAIDAIAAVRFPGWHVAEATRTLTPPMTLAEYDAIPF